MAGYVSPVHMLYRLLSAAISQPWKLAISAILNFFFLSSKRLLFEMCLIKSIIANLCPIMIHFNALDFSECRSNEVINVFCRSVYIDIYNWTSWRRTS